MHVAPGNRDLLPFWVFFGLTIGCGISTSSILSLAKSDENARSPGKSRIIAILGVFRLKTSPGLAVRVTKMAIARFRGPKMCGTFDHWLGNFNLFDSVSRKICSKCT